MRLLGSSKPPLRISDSVGLQERVRKRVVGIKIDGEIDWSLELGRSAGDFGFA